MIHTINLCGFVYTTMAKSEKIAGSFSDGKVSRSIFGDYVSLWW